MKKNLAIAIMLLVISFALALFIVILVHDIQIRIRMPAPPRELTREESAALDAEIDAQMDAERGEGFAANHRIATTQLERLPAGFGPDFYGGVYIGDDGSLVILIVESKLEYAQSHSGINSLLNEGVRYRFVEYSYTEINVAFREISRIVREKSDAGCIYARNVSGVGIDTSLNRPMIHLAEYNDDMITGFRLNVYDSSMLGAFKQMDFIRLGEPVSILSIWVFILWGILFTATYGIYLMKKS